jgi:SAM-dependent methyltransferase
MNLHGEGQPSDWITRWAHLVPPQAGVLDLACGRGRHLRWWAQRGHAVTGVDRDPDALASLADLGGRVERISADIESGPWPLAQRQFGLVIVTHYLWRPLFDTIAASVAPGGLLLYETFAAGHEALGRPRRPDFLLQAGELLTAFAGLQVLGFEEGRLDDPPRHVQRLAACQPVLGTDGAPAQYRLPHPVGGWLESGIFKES